MIVIPRLCFKNVRCYTWKMADDTAGFPLDGIVTKVALQAEGAKALPHPAYFTITKVVSQVLTEM